MFADTSSYETLVSSFAWSLPPHFNIAEACLDRHAARTPERPALLRYEPGRALAPISYGELRRRTDALARHLAANGAARGDRVAILLPQSVDTAAAHFAIYKLGAIAVPLAALFGVDALRFRLAHSGARILVTDAAGAERLSAIRAELPDLALVLAVEEAPEPSANEPRLEAAETTPDDPALMIYTSGTTGPPKGALHGHRVLIGHLPGFLFTHAPAPQPGDRLWTPSDWAWAGGLLNALLPSLYFGIPVVFGPFRRFDPAEAFALIAEAEVRNLFLPPTALKLMRGVEAPRRRFGFDLRTVGSAGEALGRETFEWAEATLGVPVNEFYGQTECNYVLGSSRAFGVSRAGAIGKPVPGHAVAVIDADGRPVAPGATGEIAIRRPDPTMFLGYWRDEAATEAKFRGDWLLTGDQAIIDGGGYVTFVGRSDDVIISAGYRIGPAEIEDCLVSHPAVALAAAVGKPDPVRTEIVKAYVVLKAGRAPSPELADDIRRHVRTRLSAAEYPREIAFVDEIPLTTSGKVIRRSLRERAAAGG